MHKLLEWYRAGEDVEALLPRLWTNLGHRDSRSTYWYLSAAPELLSLAAGRLELAQGVISMTLVGWPILESFFVDRLARQLRVAQTSRSPKAGRAAGCRRRSAGRWSRMRRSAPSSSPERTGDVVGQPCVGPVDASSGRHPLALGPPGRAECAPSWVPRSECPKAAGATRALGAGTPSLTALGGGDPGVRPRAVVDELGGCSSGAIGRPAYSRARGTWQSTSSWTRLAGPGSVAAAEPWARRRGNGAWSGSPRRWRAVPGPSCRAGPWRESHSDVRHRGDPRPGGLHRRRRARTHAPAPWRRPWRTADPTARGAGSTRPRESPSRTDGSRSSGVDPRAANRCARRADAGSSPTTESSTTHASLRARLEESGAVFRGTSDTEVLVVGLDRWGLDETLEGIEGMFAFGAWDAASRTLHLARDRFGEKPLFYGWTGGRFAFASELKAFHAIPRFDPVIDRAAVAQFLRLNCVPAPQCIYGGMAKLLPGSRVSVGAGARPGPPPCRRSPTGLPTRPSTPRLAQPCWSTTARRRTGSRRRSPTRSQRAWWPTSRSAPCSPAVSTRASSWPSCNATRHGRSAPSRSRSPTSPSTSRPRPRRWPPTSERTTPRSRCRPRRSSTIIPRVADMWDEPFSDSSQLPTHLVSQVARRSVTVALSGDGGDELFAGYNRHAWLDRVWRMASPLPRPVRRSVGRSLRAVPPGSDRLGGLHAAVALAGAPALDQGGQSGPRARGVERATMPTAR